MNAQLEQRNPEWYAQRVGRITASRVGAILGIGKFQSREDVMRAMVREALGAESEFTGNEATEYGQAHEADALAAYEAREGVMIEPCGLCVHPGYDWIAASPDGLIGADGLIEAKAPYRARYMEPSEEYRAQMQLQMACTGRAWCDFAVWRKGEPLAVTRVERDDLWFGRVLQTLTEFITQYNTIIASPELAAPYLAPKERTDAAWREAAQAWIEAKAALVEAEKREKHAKATLEELAPAGASGCGVNLVRCEREGSIRYAEAIKAMLPDADLTPWRGKPSTYYTAKEQK